MFKSEHKVSNKSTKTKPPQKTNYSKTSQTHDEIHACQRCDTEHFSRSCPAYGKRCKKCGGLNYFAKCSLTRKPNSRKKKVQAIEANEAEDYDSNFTISTITIEYESAVETDDEDILLDIDSIDDQGKEDWIPNIEQNGCKIAMKLDTRASERFKYENI